MQLIGISNDIRLISNFIKKIYVMIAFNSTVNFVIWYVVKKYQMCRILSLIHWCQLIFMCVCLYIQYFIYSLVVWYFTTHSHLESNNLPQVWVSTSYIYLIQYQDLIPISNFPASRIRTLIQLVGKFGGASIPTTYQCSKIRREWHIIPKISRNFLLPNFLFNLYFSKTISIS